MPGPAENILVRGVNWLGDAIMTAPALTRLREARPQARITLFSPQKLAGLWERQPFIDEVLTFPPDATVWQAGRLLRGKGFTVGVAFPNSVRSALELWLAKIPVRIGIGRGLFLTQPLAPRPDAIKMRKRTAGEVQKRIRERSRPEIVPPEAHHVRHYLHLVGALGASIKPLTPRIEVGPEAMEHVRGKFGLGRLDGQPWFGLNAGAEYGPAKRWPAERFIEAALELRKKTNCRWVIFGGSDEIDLAAKITREVGEPVLNLAGKTNLRELAAALKICDLVLTNDTGPMHLACAVGARIVAIFGSTSPELTGPIFSSRARIIRHPVPCAPCFLRECPIDLRCLRGISPDQVVAAALEHLRA
ncbi:MAG TPA: glycosyltransferase family 9 protein [Verrucomicrobiae bacterium]|jgi:heptosyltransferase-2|nr:glycosyltransferase family 9 protein [Verrucomicrobiae bacterium]